MKIKKIDISSFGKFKNFSMVFSDGFNLIYGKNEGGKSTIMAFISLMLYGTSGSSSRLDISKNIRKKYLPWSGEKMSGEMEIECNGKSYLIHKEFRASAKTDKVSVTDTETGEKLILPPDTEVGKYFLGIDASGFEKSIFGGSAESFAGSESSDISARLSNLFESGEDSVSPKTVLSRIENAKEDLIKKRSKGRLTLAQDKAEEISNKIEAIKAKEAQRQKLKDEFEEIQKDLSALYEISKQHRKALEIEEKRRLANNYKTLSGLYKNLNALKKSLEEMLPGASLMDFISNGNSLKKSVIFSEEKLSGIEKPSEFNYVSEDDMKKYFILLEEERREKAESISLFQNGKKSKKRYRTLLWGGFIGLFLVILGIIGGGFWSLAYVLSAVGAVLSAVCFFLAYNAKKRILPEESLFSSEATTKIGELFSKRGCKNTEEFEKSYRDGISAKERERLYELAYEEHSKALSDFISFINLYTKAPGLEEAIMFLNQIEENISTIEKAEQKALDYANTYEIKEQDALKLLSLAQDMERGLPEESEAFVDFEETEKQISLKNSRLLEIKGMLGGETENVSALMRELAKTQETVQEMQEYYDSLCMVEHALLEAEDEMRRSFAPELKERTSEILNLLTNGKYKQLLADKLYDIEVKSEETLGYRKWHYLSRGTCAQSYLALRIAVCEMLSDKESLPLMLDDILSDYDEERASLAMSFLMDYSKKGHQVLFFTCHNAPDVSGELCHKHNI